MTFGGMVFMSVSVGFVLTLVTWCYRQVLKGPPPDTR